VALRRKTSRLARGAPTARCPKATTIDLVKVFVAHRGTTTQAKAKGKPERRPSEGGEGAPGLSLNRL
jgi:hypothetical protein